MFFCSTSGSARESLKKTLQKKKKQNQKNKARKGPCSNKKKGKKGYYDLRISFHLLSYKHWMLYCLAVSVRGRYPRPVRTYTEAEGLEVPGIYHRKALKCNTFFVAMPCKIPLTF